MLTQVDVVAALHDEGRCLFDGWGRDAAGPMRVRIGGVGAANAARAARAAVDAGARALLSWGFAAALEPGLRAGTLLLPSEVIGADGRRYAVSGLWRQQLLGAVGSRLVASGGALVETAHALPGARAKAELRSSSGAAAADMESAAVARVAFEASLPFAVLRCVSDSAASPVPAAALTALGADGALDLAALTAALARRPQDLPALIGLVPGFMRARRALRRAAAQLRASGTLGPP